MSENKTLTMAMRMIASYASYCGSAVNRADPRQHPELKNVYYTAVYHYINSEIKRARSYKENSGKNSREAINWLMNDFYKLFINSGKTEEEFSEYYFKQVFLKNIRDKKLGVLYHPIHEVHANGEEVDYDKIDKELSALIAPEEFVNDTNIVGIISELSHRLGVDNDIKATVDDMDYFNLWYRGKDINDYMQLLLPCSGYRFVPKSMVNNKKVFIFTAWDRRSILRLLARDNDKAMSDYINVFKRKPIECEYHFYCYKCNSLHFIDMKKWFDDEAKSLEE